jgi:hypothetical protein
MAAKRARSLPKRLSVRKAVMVLHRRVAKLEREVFKRREPIGFCPDARGDRIEQDEDFDWGEET